MSIAGAVMTTAVAFGLVSVVPTRGSALAGTSASSYCVGAAKSDITPTPAMIAAGNFYLGGYGIGPVHPAGSVLRRLYSRAIAIGVPTAAGTCPGAAGNQVVTAADDLQGHFLAYQ